MPEIAVRRRTLPALAMAGLSYRYPNSVSPALDDVSLNLAGGEFVVLAGASASGKSTLMAAACGLVPHFHGGEVSGEVATVGIDAVESGPGELASVCGYLAQDPETQVVSTTVAAELGLPLEMRGDPAEACARGVEEVALALAIPHLVDRTVDTLSGGELQRVALGAALVTRPSLVLLDEPTSQLDPVAGDELIWLLRRLNEEWGMAVLLAEHRLERCLPAADRVIAMDAGRIAFDGRPRDFLGWSLEAEPVLATPAARLFSLAGIKRLPTGVRDARRTLEAAGRADHAATGKLTARDHPRPPTGEIALRLRDVWVERERDGVVHEVLGGVDLAINRGERVALMGRNGVGKSTLLRALAGILEVAKGRVDLAGEVALLTQNPSDFLVRERVGDELPGGVGAEALRIVGLEVTIERDPRDLSGGERQRLALAIAMAGRTGRDSEGPALVCLDEPTRGMDRDCKVDLEGLINRQAQAGSAVIVATHDVEFAASFADRVVLLGRGRVIADGPVGEILSGGWYFATEVARILGIPGVISPEQGAAAMRGTR